ncbi:MAG: hypothetical protein IJZ86_10515 [Bacteroides sp.]|nr:hypothetical protein [Bacteroides sp.]
MCHKFNEYKSSQKIKFYHFSKDNRDESEIKNMTSEQLVLALQQKNTQVVCKAWGNSVYMAFVPNVSLGYAEDGGYLYELELKHSVNYIESTEKEYAQGDTPIEGTNLHVPSGCGSTYKSSDWGKCFTNVVEMD